MDRKELTVIYRGNDREALDAACEHVLDFHIAHRPTDRFPEQFPRAVDREDLDKLVAQGRIEEPWQSQYSDPPQFYVVFPSRNIGHSQIHTSASEYMVGCIRAFMLGAEFRTPKPVPRPKHKAARQPRRV